jgi:hypothetical protein
MNIRLTTQKLICLITMGMIMPVFVASAAPAKPRESPVVEIVFAVKDPARLAGYDLEGQEFLFGGYGAPMTYRAGASAADLALMQDDPNFYYAEIDATVSAAAIYPDDKYFTRKNNDQQWHLKKIKMPEAWEFGKGSRNVRVAVIDTGIHASHVELRDGRVKSGYNILTNEEIRPDDDSDDNGHGTAVAGVIGAMTNNKLGIAGINWDVSLVPVKVMSAEGKGRISDISQGIVWAADHESDIVNLSLGGTSFGKDQTLNNAVIYAFNRGSVIVSAAGNDLAEHGNNLDTDPVYPICADGGSNMVIGVAATDRVDKKAQFSNFGHNCVDVSAPGVSILTTTYLPSDPSDRHLIYGSGTSLSAPVVSGVAALLKANKPGLTNAEVRDIIINSADDINDRNQEECLGSSCNGFLGKGRINAFAALSPQPLVEGALIRRFVNQKVYYVSGGEKHEVTPFVFRQRGFSEANVLFEERGVLSELQTGEPLPPTDGALVKSPDDPTVYYVHRGVKRPLSALVFKSRNFNFSQIMVIPSQDLGTIKTGEWYWPPDGVLVLVKGDPTVYVMENGVKRPVTYFVFTQRRLSFTRVVNVTQEEFMHIPNAPDKYWLAPLDGTLVKTPDSPAIYLMVDGTRKPLSASAFANRKFKFSDVKILTQAEMETIMVGRPIEN